MLKSLDMVQFHFTLSLHAHSLQDWISIPIVRPLDDSQEPLDFHGHGSWSMCKAALLVAYM
jgi:hypothetical protein